MRIFIKILLLLNCLPAFAGENQKPTAVDDEAVKVERAAADKLAAKIESDCPSPGIDADSDFEKLLMFGYSDTRPMTEPLDKEKFVEKLHKLTKDPDYEKFQKILEAKYLCIQKLVKPFPADICPFKPNEKDPVNNTLFHTVWNTPSLDALQVKGETRKKLERDFKIATRAGTTPVQNYLAAPGPEGIATENQLEMTRLYYVTGTAYLSSLNNDLEKLTQAAKENRPAEFAKNQFSRRQFEMEVTRAALVQLMWARSGVFLLHPDFKKDTGLDSSKTCFSSAELDRAGLVAFRKSQAKLLSESPSTQQQKDPEPKKAGSSVQ